MERRRFIHCSLCASAGAWLLGCGDDGTPSPLDDAGVAGDGGDPRDASPGDSGAVCADPLAGASMLGIVPFANEDTALETVSGRGWDGRLFTDLSVLGPAAMITDNESFYIRTLYPDRLVPSVPWRIAVDGLVDAPASLVLDDLSPLVADQGVHVLECSGNFRRAGFGMLSAARWAGAPVMDVVESLLSPTPAATRLLVSGFDDHSVPSAGGHSTPGASWVFTFEQLRQAGAFFATEMNGEPLPADHGEPVRLYVPGWYGCTCIKWVDRLRLVDDDEPATSQMMEFASRTHQRGVPSLARDYIAATMDQAAMPVRIEKWRLDGRVVYRVVGVMWGGYEPTDALSFSSGVGDLTPVDVCPAPTQNQTWTLWQHRWEPTEAREYSIRMSIDDDAIPTRRLDTGFYARDVVIDEVTS